jgi:hypothetical protein
MRMKYSKSGAILPITSAETEMYFSFSLASGRMIAGCENVKGIDFFFIHFVLKNFTAEAKRTQRKKQN